MTVARELNNTTLIAQTLRFQADRLYYTGDLPGARGLAEQASQAAGRASDRSLTLLAQANAAITAAAIQPTRPLAATLARLGAGCRNPWPEISRRRVLDLPGGRVAETGRPAERASGSRPHAGQGGTARVCDCRKREPVLFAPKSFVLAAMRTLAASTGSRLRLLTELKGEDGNQNVLKRADLGAIYAESERWSKSS